MCEIASRSQPQSEASRHFYVPPLQRANFPKSLAVLCLLLGTASARIPPPEAVLGGILGDFQKILDGNTAGYLDLGYGFGLAPVERIDRPYGTLRGFGESRHLAAYFADPDSEATVRGGVFGSWSEGGWSDDTWLLTPSEAHQTDKSGGIGLAVSALEADLSLAVGAHWIAPRHWDGNLDRERIASEAIAPWFVSRWNRLSILGAARDLEPGQARLRWGTSADRLLPLDPWFWPQLEASFEVSRADWNRWDDRSGWNGELALPVWHDRLGIRGDAGNLGLNRLRLESDLGGDGLVGLDVSISRLRGSRLRPGFRLRAPLLTFAWNDVDEALANGVSGGTPLWSLRFQMAWRDQLSFWRPGRHASIPERSRKR